MGLEVQKVQLPDQKLWTFLRLFCGLCLSCHVVVPVFTFTCNMKLLENYTFVNIHSRNIHCIALIYLDPGNAMVSNIVHFSFPYETYSPGWRQTSVIQVHK